MRLAVRGNLKKVRGRMVRGRVVRGEVVERETGWSVVQERGMITLGLKVVFAHDTTCSRSVSMPLLYRKKEARAGGILMA